MQTELQKRDHLTLMAKDVKQIVDILSGDAKCSKELAYGGAKDF